MVHIPHDIVIDILLRLPAKSLVRFRSVCKVWHDSIRDPNFIETHLNRAISSDSCTLFLASLPCSCLTNEQAYVPHTHIRTVENADSFTRSPVEIEVPFELQFDSFGVLGTCNGLVCLGRRRLVCLLNPTTREFKNVMFDENISFQLHDNYGLGYDQSNKDYKLVQYSRSPTDDFVSQVRVRSLNDGSCSTLSNISYRIADGALGVYLNGVLHWLGFYKQDRTLRIICFDVGREMFGWVLRPVGCGKLVNSLGVLRGELSILLESSTVGTEIWVMKGDGESNSWSKLFFIPRSILRHNRAPWRTVCFPENGKLLLMDYQKLVSYDPKQNSVSHITYPPIALSGLAARTAYVGSLVPLASGRYVSSARASRKRKKMALQKIKTD